MLKNLIIFSLAAVVILALFGYAIYLGIPKIFDDFSNITTKDICAISLGSILMLGLIACLWFMFFPFGLRTKKISLSKLKFEYIPEPPVSSYHHKKK